MIEPISGWLRSVRTRRRSVAARPLISLSIANRASMRSAASMTIGALSFWPSVQRGAPCARRFRAQFEEFRAQLRQLLIDARPLLPLSLAAPRFEAASRRTAKAPPRR
jgi:hypothetical protein